MTKPIELVIVTGMSGAGKTVAIQSFEDLGYFTIDNMPPTLLPKFIKLVEQSGETNKVALVVDMRSRLFSMKSMRFWTRLRPMSVSRLRFSFWMRLMASWCHATKRPDVVTHWLQTGVFLMALL